MEYATLLKNPCADDATKTRFIAAKTVDAVKELFDAIKAELGASGP